MKMNKVSLVVAGVVLAGGLSLAPLRADEPAGASELEKLRKDVEAIKAGQTAIQADLQEIKKLLRSAPSAQPQAIGQLVDVAGEPFRGDKNAKVTLIEFSEYQCPFCSRHVKDTVPQIEKEFVSTGKLKYVFRDMPLAFHKDAPKAAEAAHCAGEQGKFWEMHDRLYANQKSIALTNLPAHAEAIGVDVAKFQKCLESGKYADTIKTDMADAAKLGISGTPSFVLGLTQPNDGKIKVLKVIKGAQPYSAFAEAINSILAPAAQ